MKKSATIMSLVFLYVQMLQVVHSSFFDNYILACPDVDACVADLDCGVNGVSRDVNGCRLCECNSEPPECIPPLCLAFEVCPYGRQTDENGCETCDCAPPPVCPPLDCEDECPFGYKLDVFGCDTCDCCGPLICPRILCPVPFTHDYDEEGCPVNCRCEFPK